MGLPELGMWGEDGEVWEVEGGGHATLATSVGRERARLGRRKRVSCLSPTSRSP